jgi:hypothetical protein
MGLLARLARPGWPGPAATHRALLHDDVTGRRRLHLHVPRLLSRDAICAAGLAGASGAHLVAQGRVRRVADGHPSRERLARLDCATDLSLFARRGVGRLRLDRAEPSHWTTSSRKTSAIGYGQLSRARGVSRHALVSALAAWMRGSARAGAAESGHKISGHKIRVVRISSGPAREDSLVILARTACPAMWPMLRGTCRGASLSTR